MGKELEQSKSKSLCLRDLRETISTLAKMELKSAIHFPWLLSFSILISSLLLIFHPYEANCDLLKLDSNTNSSLHNLTTPELIKAAGYPVETHTVITNDSYILTAFRIPSSPNQNPSNGPQPKSKPVVLLQHGLLTSSATWLVNSPGKNLPLLLSDLGYDIWLGNSRGTLYSRNNTVLSPEDPEFWNFTFHEMGIYDLPALIDHILETTGQDSLIYIGHSMGTTQGLVLVTERPEYNEKIKLMILMAPVAFTTYLSSPIRILAPLLLTGVTQSLLAKLATSTGEYSPNDYMKQQFRQWACQTNISAYAICVTPTFVQFGFDYAQVNLTLIPDQVGHYPQGSSVYSVIHLAQGINSFRFAQYDYGLLQNLQVYGTPSPPDYDLDNISAPLVLIWGENDWLADATDVQNLASALPSGALKGNYRVNYTAWNHGDFLQAKDVNFYVNDKVISLVNQYS